MLAAMRASAARASRSRKSPLMVARTMVQLESSGWVVALPPGARPKTAGPSARLTPGVGWGWLQPEVNRAARASVSADAREAAGRLLTQREVCGQVEPQGVCAAVARGLRKGWAGAGPQGSSGLGNGGLKLVISETCVKLWFLSRLGEEAWPARTMIEVRA